VTALAKLREWFGGTARAAGYPAIGRAVATRFSAGSYYDFARGGGGYYHDGSKWAHGLGSTGRAPILNHAAIRANARSAVHDSPTARAIIDRYEQTVVDTGVRVECTPDADLLGITQERAAEWARDVETRFHLWASSQLATASQDMTFYQAQRFSMRARKRDGEYFVRLYYDSRRDLLNPLRIGFIDPNQIRGDALTFTSWPQTCGDGIERDGRGREIAYNVTVTNPDGTAKPERITAASPRTGLPLMLHGFAPEYAGQSRGFSPLAHAIHEFELLTDFTEAQIKKAILQSSISMVAEPNDDGPALNPFSDMGSGPSSAFEAPVEPGVTTDALSGGQLNYSEINDVNMRPGGVGVFNLESGKLVPFGNTAPSESFGTFVDAFVGHLAASVNMPPEILSLKFSSNYSASRAALILFWRTACVERDEEASDFYNPVFRAWLAGEIGSGRISAPGWSDPRLRAAWCSCSWNGPPMPNIDPAKTARADMAYVQIGAQTLDNVARNFNGSSGAANRAKNTIQIPQLTPVPWAGSGSSERSPKGEGENSAGEVEEE